MPSHNILGISGSLRAGSLNTALLQAAQRWARSTTGLEIYIYEGLDKIPPFDPDRNEPTPPPEVKRFREAIDSADGLLISSPEYNYGIPGVLKNALDWASIPSPPETEASLADKHVALMGASPSPFGTVRAQLALRQLFLWTNSPVVTQPEVHVFDAFARFDDHGEVIDQRTKGFVIDLLRSLQSNIEKDSLLEVGTGVGQAKRERRSA